MVCKQEIPTSTLSGTISTNRKIAKQVDGRGTIGRLQHLVKDKLGKDWENAFCPFIAVLKKLEVSRTHH